MPQGNWPKSGDSERQERLRMMTKLFSIYPLGGHANPKASIAAYIEETQTIHPLILSHALKRLTSKADRKWLPTPAEIKVEAAKVVREFQPRSTHAFALGYNPNREGDESIPVDLLLTKGQQLNALPEATRKLAQLVERTSQRMGAK